MGKIYRMESKCVTVEMIKMRMKEHVIQYCVVMALCVA